MKYIKIFDSVNPFSNIYYNMIKLRSLLQEILGAKNYWMLPDGKIIPLDHQDHIEWFERNVRIGNSTPYNGMYNTAFRMGYIRLINVGKVLDFTYLTTHPPTPKKLKVLKDFAIENGLLLYDGEFRRNIELDEHILLKEILNSRGYWILPNGGVEEVDNHINWLMLNVNITGFSFENGYVVTAKGDIADEYDIYTAAFKMGYIRVVEFSNSNDLAFNYLPSKPPTNLQIRELKNLAIETERELYDVVKKQHIEV